MVQKDIPGRDGGERRRQRDLALKRLYEALGRGAYSIVVSVLARVRLSDLMVKAKRELGIRPVFLVHDEYVGIAPDEEAPELLARMIELAREPSPWWPDGPPFDAEGTVSKRYEH